MFEYAQLDGKVVGGDQGEGVLIEKVEFKFSTTKDNEEEAVAEITGFAKTVLNDKYNPSNGFKELPEPIPVTERVKFVLGGGKNADNHITFERFNRAFDIQPPLEDTPTVWERFTEDGKDSVCDKLVGGKLYFSAKKNPTKTGDKPEDYYFNSINIAKRVEAKMSAVAEKMKKLMEKRAAGAVASNFTVDD
jgi:hypothetical protein